MCDGSSMRCGCVRFAKNFGVNDLAVCPSSLRLCVSAYLHTDAAFFVRQECACVRERMPPSALTCTQKTCVGCRAVEFFLFFCEIRKSFVQCIVDAICFCMQLMKGGTDCLLRSLSHLRDLRQACHATGVILFSHFIALRALTQ